MAGWASVACGLAGAAGLGILMAIDTADVPHGSGVDAALSLLWLNGGLAALGFGLTARASRPGRAGLALAVLDLPLGLLAFGIFALTQTV